LISAIFSTLRNMARIMIVDDEPAMVEVLSEICKGLGHEVLPCGSAQKAIQSLSSAAPQLLISDMNMEGKKRRGFDVLKECQDILPETPIIMITGYPEAEDAVEAMKLGARDYIKKPFKVDEVQLRIQHAI